MGIILYSWQKILLTAQQFLSHIYIRKIGKITYAKMQKVLGNNYFRDKMQALNPVKCYLLII